MQLSPANRWMIGTFIGLAALILLALWQVRPSYDLAFFTPAPESEQEKVLVERLGQGAGARLVFIELTAAAGIDAVTLSNRMRESLNASKYFLRVENGQGEKSVADIPATLWRWRYLLVDIDWSAEGIATAVEQRVADLSAIGGPELSRLIAQDPLWSAPHALERLQFGGPGAEPHWSDGPLRAFMIVETKASPFDAAGQRLALDAIRRAHFEAAGTDAGLDLYGVGVYGARVQQVVRQEAKVLGVIAATLVLGVIVFTYRSFRLTLLSIVPLTAAILGGLVVSSLVFGGIHGITIAFGATLLGVVDDYPMYLFSHSRHMPAREGVRTLLGTLLASAGTGIVGYAALVFSGSRGLAQLGVFSLSGIFCAMLATCWLLPKLMPEHRAAAAHDDTPQEFDLSAWLWMPLLAAAIAGIAATGGVRWNDNLGELTPLPPSLLARDQEMRQRFGAPDVRYLISINANSAEAALQQTEVLEKQLGQARQQGLLASWSAVTAILPSEATQRRRRSNIPSATDLEASLVAASKPWPLRPSAFKPFLDDAATSRVLPAVTAADYKDGLLRDFVSNHLTGESGRWRSVVYVTGLDSPKVLTAWLGAVNPGARLVDLQAASESLVRSYRVRLFSILLAAFVVITALVVWYTANIRRFVWSAGTVAASVLATLALVNWLHGSVTLFHLVSLGLVAGLGVDYCLFYSRPQVSRTEFRDTRHAVIVGASSTAGGFAVLGTSSIPLLSTLGITVAIGATIMFVASRMGCRAR